MVQDRTIQSKEKRVTFLKYAIICLVGFMLAAVTGEAALAKEVKVDGSILGENSREQAKQQVLTSDLITMYGTKDSTELTYQIPAGASSSHQQLALEYEASDLLISPSSLTVEIDGEPVKTVKLTENAERKTLKLTLNKSQSSQGFHSLSLKFYGVVKEGVCVRQDSSGNWIKIYPDSHLTFGDKNEAKGAALEHYPYPFAQSGNTVEKTEIVIPDDPSSAEIEAAVKTESYLKTIDSSISITTLNESDMKRIDRPAILIGVQKHWKGKVEKLLAQSDIKAQEDKLLLAERVLTANGKQQPVLFVTAASDDVLSGKISVITDKTYAGQLSGETLAIGKLQYQTKRDAGKLTLEDFDQIIHCISLSKAGLPGERVGIAIGPPRYIKVMEAFQSNAAIHSSRLGQYSSFFNIFIGCRQADANALPDMRRIPRNMMKERRPGDDDDAVCFQPGVQFY